MDKTWGQGHLCSIATIFGAHALADTASGQLANIRYVFVVVLENEGFDSTLGPASPAPCLATELVRQGALLNHYYGIGHFSLDNYIAMIRGQTCVEDMAPRRAEHDMRRVRYGSRFKPRVTAEEVLTEGSYNILFVIW